MPTLFCPSRRTAAGAGGDPSRLVFVSDKTTEPTHPTGGGAGNLPPETHSFVGRRQELRWLETELNPSVGIRRLLSVVGVGGVGKTRLALRALGRVQEAYPDGVWLVELSPLHTAGLVGLAVVEALRLTDQSTGPVTEVVAAWADGKRLLLVLDSCEHVLADCAALVETLLPALPGLRVLVTSREPLGLPGELVLPLDPLPVADDAVTLFADRAALTGFTLDDTNRPTVEAVCRRLDGIPLALELAAARLFELSLAQLHGRLGERLPSRLDLLSAPRDGAGPPRHQTLRTAIGWSHELCAPLERLLWARLSVFAGGFCVGAAEEICAGGPLPAGRIAALLARLVEQSIVQRHRTDPARFRLLDTVQEFGADWLHALGEEHAVRLRHRDHFRRLVRQGWTEWNTGRQVAWCERTLTEHANLRAAMDCALTDPDRRIALGMAADLGFLWRHCGSLRDAQHCLDLALAADPPPGPDRTRALWARGAVALLQGDLEVAAEWAERCTDAADTQADPVAVVAAAYLTGGQLALSGRLGEAIDVLSATPRLPIRQDGFGPPSSRSGWRCPSRTCCAATTTGRGRWPRRSARPAWSAGSRGRAPSPTGSSPRRTWPAVRSAPPSTTPAPRSPGTACCTTPSARPWPWTSWPPRSSRPATACAPPASSASAHASGNSPAGPRWTRPTSSPPAVPTNCASAPRSATAPTARRTRRVSGCRTRRGSTMRRRVADG